MTTFLQRAGFLLCLTALAITHRAGAQLNPGDLLVTDTSIPGVVQIDSFTGAYNVISSGGQMQTPSGIALDATRQIYVVDSLGADDGSQVLRIDPLTGAQTLIASLLVDSARDIEVGADGKLYIAGSTYDRWSRRRHGRIVQVDLASGLNSYYRGWGRFDYPTAIARGLGTNLYVTDSAYLGGAVVGFDPLSSGTWDVARGGDLLDPIDLAVNYNGTISVLDYNAYSYWTPFRQSGGATIEIDPNRPSGVNQTPTSYDGNFLRPAAMARTWFGHLMVADDGYILRIDPNAPTLFPGANQTVAFVTPYLPAPSGMEIVPGIRWQRPRLPLDPIAFP